MGSGPKKEQEFKNLMRQAKNQGQEIIDKERYLIKDEQLIVDLANEGLYVTEYGIPPNIDLDSLITTWSYAVSQQAQILDSYFIPQAGTASTAVAFTMTNLANPTKVTPFVPPDKTNEVRLHSLRLSQIIDQHAERKDVIDLFNTLDLNIPSKNLKSPSELFDTAWEALGITVTSEVPAITSLMPMRECILRVIDLLLKRRPAQEPARNLVQKIQSILNQLAYNTIPSSAKTDLAIRGSNLQNELSGSKDKNISREKWMDTLRLATLFLFELLRSIDKSKMK